MLLMLIAKRLFYKKDQKEGFNKGFEKGTIKTAKKLNEIVIEIDKISNELVYQKKKF